MDEHAYDTYSADATSSDTYNIDNNHSDDNAPSIAVVSDTDDAVSPLAVKRKPRRSGSKTLTVREIETILDTYDAFLNAPKDILTMAGLICECEPAERPLTLSVLAKKHDLTSWQLLAELSQETDPMTIMYGLLGADDRKGLWAVLKKVSVVDGVMPANYKTAATELLHAIQEFTPQRGETLTEALDLCG